jgi:hypothetical protein
MIVRLALPALGLVFASAPPGWATEPILPTPPAATLVELEGHLGPPPPGRSAAADLALEADGRHYRLQVDEARVLAGSRLGADFLAEVAPYRPNLILRGPEPLLSRLRAAAAGDRLVIRGYHRHGVRDLQVSEIVVGPAAR